MGKSKITVNILAHIFLGKILKINRCFFNPFWQKSRLNYIAFHKNDAFYEKYLAKRRVGGEPFCRKGYRKGKQNLNVYEKRLIVSI